jgi:uncharacterized protein YbjT (DUF2867 family)
LPQTAFSIVMLGASGAVGGIAAATLAQHADVARLTLLNRRELPALRLPNVSQHTADVTRPASYALLLAGHDIAVCCLGVGQPSKVSKEQFIAIDKTAVLAFATACRAAGVARFVLLSSVGANAKSASFYLRTKGELQDGIAALGFTQVSFMQPSMIITPTNRYDWKQALTLAVWPTLSRILFGSLKKFRGIAVETLGRAVAVQARAQGSGVSTLQWEAICELGR